MIRRFCSGSATPASAAYISSVASTWTTRTPRLRANVSSTCSASFRRSRPWSTNTQVSWSPIALWISAAATDESTPPDSPRITSSAADLRADGGDRLVDVVGHVPVLRAAADVVREAREDRRALLRVRDLGMELHRVEAARRIGHRRDRARVAAPDHAESRRQRGDLVAVAHPDVEQPVALRVAAVLDAGEELRVSARAHLRVAELAHAARLDRAAELRRHRLHAVADAEHRHALRPHGGRRARRVAVGHAVRAAREHDALRREAADEIVADVVRMDLAVDVRLAQAARDQLRVLRAEVEDQDPGVRRSGHRRSARNTKAGLRRLRAYRRVTRRGNWALP